MAQDKSAEIISFGGAAEPPQTPAPQTPTPEEITNADDVLSLESMGAGAYLRVARERADLSIEAASSATKVKADHLEAIEWMRLDRLPALAYATGFVKTYARYLGLDAEATAAKFKAEALAMAPAPAPAQAPETPQGEGARLGSLFAVFAVLLFALWIGYQVIAGGGRSHDQETPLPRAEQEQAQDVRASASQEAVSPSDDPSGVSLPELITPPQNEPASSGEEDAASLSPAEFVSPAEEGTAPADEPLEAPQPETTPPVAEPRERPLPRRVRPAPRQPVIVEAELRRAAAPDYPDRCTRGADASESVTIHFDVSAEGRAVNARVLSSTNGCFESEALRTVGRWRFSPRTVDGANAVEAGKTATVNFLK